MAANNFNYADTGLFAITMVTHGDHMASVRDHMIQLLIILSYNHSVAEGNSEGVWSVSVGQCQ